MDKVVVFNDLDLGIAEITQKLCRKLLENGYAKEYTPRVTQEKYQGRYGIITRANYESDFKKLIRDIKKQEKEENKKIKVTCWQCGKEIEVETVSKRSYCDECVAEYKVQNEKEMQEYLRYRAKFMLNRSMRILENQKCKLDIREYKEPYDTLKEAIEEDYNKFDSAHEIATTMELLKNRIHVKIHPLVAKHKPDFMLRDLKVILEVDGYLHKTSLEKDYQFDIDMRKELGTEWEIIRIPTEYIENNIIKLVDAIIEMKKYKQKVRKENNGLIPQWFSARDKKVWKELKM